VDIIPILSDNYVFLFTCPHTGQTTVIDPGVDEPIIRWLDQRKLKLDHVLLTHHHWDHTSGVSSLRRRYSAQVYGSNADIRRLPPLDKTLVPGQTLCIGESQFSILALDGHTIGHIGYYSDEHNIVFVGDTLFAMGCGKRYEGTTQSMWDSLVRIRSLPDNTKIYCAHEYSVVNSEFATATFPEIAAFRIRMTQFKKDRANGLSTIPTTVGQEKLSNPFLMADNPNLASQLRLPPTSDAHEVFGRLRELKDKW
jgi:hydroxyacylglutathione hydrolase